MKIVDSVAGLNEALDIVRKSGKTIGFVPTMGALHEGHMALIERAVKATDFVVASIFVNPTQFTNASDLELYPRTPEKDAALLQQHGCDLAFFPTAPEMYSSDYVPPVVPLGSLESVMEGEFRPGHFKGVVQVVYRFFDLIRPDFAFFGLKDVQQVAVIKHMVSYLNMKVNIVACPTLRESSGLAMSSRNARLSAEEKEIAVHISRTLTHARELAKMKSPAEVKADAEQFFSSSPMRLEYFRVVDPATLTDLSDRWVPGAVACIAGYCGDVRLIDNMTLN